MTREHLPPLREVRGDVDPLSKLIAAADRDGPSPERLARMGERLSVALDASGAQLNSRNPFRAAGAKWIAGIGIAGVALTLVLTRAESKPASRAVSLEARASQVAPAPAATTSSLPATLAAPVVPAPAEPVQALQRSNVPAPRVRSDRARALGSSSQTTELTLLREAQGALSDSPKLALAKLAEHRARYPHGLLEQEREVLQIEALLNANRVGAARAAATSFSVSFPQSAHLRRIERLLARGTKRSIDWESDRDESTHR